MASLASAIARLSRVPQATPSWTYILDFYCAAAKLAVEVDGWCHNLGDPDYDRRRDAWLARQGITVMRYPAVNVLRDLDDVACSIAETAVAPTSP